MKDPLCSVASSSKLLHQLLTQSNWFSGTSEEKHSSWLWSVSHQIQLQEMSNLKLFQVCHHAAGKDLFSSTLYNSLYNTRKRRFQETNLFERGEKQHIPLAFLFFIFLALFTFFFLLVYLLQSNSNIRFQMIFHLAKPIK